MKGFIRLSMLIVLAFSVSGRGEPAKNRDVLFQVSVINALLEGVYDGNVTVADLKKRGDFGLGTFNALDGEMVALDGAFYQVKSDGVAYLVPDSMRTPFAVVTFFDADETMKLTGPLDFDQLKTLLDGRLKTTNVFYAIKVEGRFKYVKTRSPRRQGKPYPDLTEALKDQAVFEFNDVSGTLVGFRSPDYLGGVNVPGYHLHFLTADNKAGGHLLACDLVEVKVELDYTSEFLMWLPGDSDFLKASLGKDQEKSLDKVEK